MKLNCLDICIRFTSESFLKAMASSSMHIISRYGESGQPWRTPLLLGPEGARVKVLPLFIFLIISVLNFLNFARLESLNSDWAWVLKWKFCCTEDWPGKVGYWCFLAFFFLLIRPRDLHCTDTSLLSKRRSISKVHTHVKAPSAGCCNSLLLILK